MHIARQRQRTTVDIAVTLTTVLESLEARIIDLSEHGAQIVGASVLPGAKVQIEYMGQTVYAQCMWSEVDRMGVRFPFDLTEGPLHDALTLGLHDVDPDALDGRPTFSASPSQASMRARRPGTINFGRRTHH